MPKDTKELLASYGSVPQTLIAAVVKSNETRKQFISTQIISRKPRVVGIFRLVMKQNSDNFRESAIFDIIRLLRNQKNIKIFIFEPLLSCEAYEGLKVEKDFEVFKEECDLIIANRTTPELDDVKEKVFSRDLFRDN